MECPSVASNVRSREKYDEPNRVEPRMRAREDSAMATIYRFFGAN